MGNSSDFGTSPNKGLANSVYVIDEQEDLITRLAPLFRSIKLNVQPYSSALDFLDFYDGSTLGCLLVDARAPGMNGLDLLEHLHQRNALTPVIIMSASADVSMAMQAIHLGAYDFLERPLNEQMLLDCVQKAIAYSSAVDSYQHETRKILRRLSRLTPREREVMSRVVRGQLNKQIASALSLKTKTIEQYRAQVMDKSGAQSLAELVKMAIVVGLVDVPKCGAARFLATETSPSAPHGRPLWSSQRPRLNATDTQSYSPRKRRIGSMPSARRDGR